jgi:predicted nucleic acid-binding protein
VYRVVLDTNQIIAAGSTWILAEPPLPDPAQLAQRVVHHVAAHENGVVSEMIAFEYIRKLIDRGHPHERIERYMGYLLGALEHFHVTITTCTHPPADPDDLKFILCAVEAGAHLLVSEDHDLLVLEPHYNPPKILCRDDVAVTFGLV